LYDLLILFIPESLSYSVPLFPETTMPPEPNATRRHDVDTLDVDADGVVHTVRANPGQLSALSSVSHSKSEFYGAFVWARRALKS
jgi:hypothetical protein